jgi:hypothetical protein
MVTSRVRWLLGLALFCVPGLAAGQQPAPAAGPGPQAPAAPGTVNVQVFNGGPGWPAGDPTCFAFDVKVLLGLPTGVRLQVPFDSGPDHAFVIEGAFGAFPGEFRSATFFGLGPRANLTIPRFFGRDALILNPGISLNYFTGRESTLALQADVEIGWLHSLNNRVAWEIGVDVGLGIGVASFDDVDRAGHVYPVINFFTGLRF